MWINQLLACTSTAFPATPHLGPVVARLLHASPAHDKQMACRKQPQSHSKGNGHASDTLDRAQRSPGPAQGMTK